MAAYYKPDLKIIGKSIKNRKLFWREVNKVRKSIGVCVRLSRM